MFRFVSRPALLVAQRVAPHQPRWFGSTIGRRSDPLRILFCGSDEFSCKSLEAVFEEHAKNRALVESLDVMVLPPRRVGRGLKDVRQVPCKLLAEKMGLQVHQRETFRGWEIPEATNLIIAVSFGLFVPPRILRSAQYGGLNVHPSLLPDLRGPAPIHHAILRGDSHTGVSLQTLDDKAFDHGTVLAQTPSPGLLIPDGCSVQQLTSLLAPIGAEMLVQGLRDGVHLLPRHPAGWKDAQMAAGEELTHAPKVTKADAMVNWTQWSSVDFSRRMRALGPLWTRAVNKKGQVKRLIWQDVETTAEEAAGGRLVKFVQADSGGLTEDSPARLVKGCEDGSCIIQLVNGENIRVRRIKEEGKAERDAAAVFSSYALQG